MNVLLLLGDFGVPSLVALLASRHRPVCVVLATQTTAPPPATPIDWIRAHAHPFFWPGTFAPSPRDYRPWTVAATLARNSIPFVEATGLVASDFFRLIERYAVDLLLSIGYPRFLPTAVLEKPPGGGVNVHPSLLPRYRGPSPVFWQIALGEEESGVTLHRMTAEVDAGPILLQVKTRIVPEETTGALYLRLARLAASLLPEALTRLETGALPERQPDFGIGSTQRRFQNEDSLIDWSQPAEDLARLVRACSPFPGAQTRLVDGECVRIWRARAWEGPTRVPSGQIVARRRWSFDVTTGRGLLRVKTATSNRGHRFPTWGRPWKTLVGGASLGAGESGQRWGRRQE